MNQKELNKKLKQIIRDLKPYQPEKVILYGSYAKGNPRKESDIDLLVIKKTNKDYFASVKEICWLLRPKKYYGTNKYIKGLDPIVYMPFQIKKRIAMNDFFIKDILGQGKVIYEKSK